MRRADKLGARGVLIVGPDEMTKSRALMRHMATKEQTEVDFADVDESLVALFAPPRQPQAPGQQP
jgi:histidyl-tRNA synthetase